jgi:hypothetical protein
MISSHRGSAHRLEFDQIAPVMYIGHIRGAPADHIWTNAAIRARCAPSLGATVLTTAGA